MINEILSFSFSILLISKFKKFGTNALSIFGFGVLIFLYSSSYTFFILSCRLLMRLQLYLFSINSEVVSPSFINFINSWLSLLMWIFFELFTFLENRIKFFERKKKRVLKYIKRFTIKNFKTKRCNDLEKLLLLINFIKCFKWSK